MDLEHDQQPDPAPATQPTVLESAPQPRTAWWRRRPVQAAGVAAGIAAVAVGAWFAGRGSSETSATAAPSPSPSQIDVAGTLTVPFLGTNLYGLNAKDTAVGANTDPRIDDPCVTLGGFSDIAQGAAVTVGGQTGQTLGIGSLSAGDVQGEIGKPASCRFAFSIRVPAGQSVYTVTISHRGTQAFTPEQVAQGLSLTLGD